MDIYTNLFTGSHAGTALIAALTDPTQQPDILASIRSAIDEFKRNHIPVGSDGQVIRVGHRFALTAAVGELCINLGFLPWEQGEAISGVSTCYRAWIETRGGVGNLEADQIVAQVRRFIELHGESRFTEWLQDGIPSSNIRTINRVGFRRVTTVGTEYFVLPESFRSDMCIGHDPKYVMQVLTERGYLNVGNDGKEQIPTRLPEMGLKRVYHLLPIIMGAAPVNEPTPVISQPIVVSSNKPRFHV